MLIYATFTKSRPLAESAFMTISKELIEKYHSGNCTPEEIQLVEAWLFDDDTAVEPIQPYPTGESKSRIRDEMWDEISTVLPARKQSAVRVFFKPFWWQAAAILLISLAGVATFFLTNQDTTRGIIVVKNASATVNQNLDGGTYSLSVGPKSNVEINNKTGRIDFCGTMMINPKRDIELTIQGTCARPDEKSAKMVLKKGQNYIALNYSNTANANEVIILPQESLTGLPPLMQRQLMMQFDI